jgi:hypothetical protein
MIRVAMQSVLSITTRSLQSTTQFPTSPDTIPSYRIKVMSLASLEDKRTLIRVTCFEHKHSGSNIPRNLFFSNVKCSRRRHTVISYMRVLRNTTIANSIKKKKKCKAHKHGYCRRSQMNWQRKGQALLPKSPYNKHEDMYEDRVDCMRYGEENHCSSKRRQHSNKEWVRPCSDMNPACSYNLCTYSDK